MSNPLGTELKRSKYRLLGLVGQGQFGRVFCAAHRRTGRLVALKNLEHQRFPTHKFLRELRILLSLQHPNIVTCYALEHTRTGRYLVMDYCEGGTLRTLIEGDCRLSTIQAYQLVLNILAGLDHAHSRGIVHCDIKPDNILLNVQPMGWVARISDFGIARLSQELVGHEGLGNTGSPAYMAPERFYGQYFQSSDLYSVGVLLFEMLTGYRPFSGTPAELMSGHLNQPVKLPDSIPEVWRSLLITALQKLPARRFRSAADMLVALQRVGESAGYVWGDNSPIYLPLLQPLSIGTTHPHFTLQPCQLLTQAVAHLARFETTSQTNTDAGGLYQASDYQVTVYPNLANSGELNDATPSTPVIELATPIKAIFPRPQGCFVVTQKAITLVVPQTSLKKEIMATPDLLCLADVPAQGNWLAVVTCPDMGQGTLHFVGLDIPEQSPQALALKAIPLLKQEKVHEWLRLVALDTRHVAVVAQAYTPQKSTSGVKPNAINTVFEIFTRRGNRLGSLSVPLCLTQVFPTHKPYRLMAMDQQDPHSVIMLDLKPFRVLRFGLEIAPTFLEVTRWGYVLANPVGQIVLLDNYGQRISQIEGPPNITAIASINSHQVAVATWSNSTGGLHIIDLKALGIDLLF